MREGMVRERYLRGARGGSLDVGLRLADRAVPWCADGRVAVRRQRVRLARGLGAMDRANDKIKAGDVLAAAGLGIGAGQRNTSA